MILARTVAISVTLALAACSNSPAQDDRICNTPGPIPTEAANTFGEQMMAADRCFHAWAYRLAGAPGPNREITDAVYGACEDTIDRLVMLERKEFKNSNRDMWQAHFARQALFHVVQARAGSCDIP